jgi:hypothetical protein
MLLTEEATATATDVEFAEQLLRWLKKRTAFPVSERAVRNGLRRTLSWLPPGTFERSIELLIARGDASYGPVTRIYKGR